MNKPKDIYKMVNDRPMWQNLEESGWVYQQKLRAIDYGFMAETLARSLLHDDVMKYRIIDGAFPDIEILATRHIHMPKENGNYIFEVDYTKDGKYGKKALILEVKHGKAMISQQQLRRYCDFTRNPSTFMKKADEVKIVYIFYNTIDTQRGICDIHISELSKSMIDSVVTSEPLSPAEAEDYSFSLRFMMGLPLLFKQDPNGIRELEGCLSNSQLTKKELYDQT